MFLSDSCLNDTQTGSKVIHSCTGQVEGPCGVMTQLVLEGRGGVKLRVGWAGRGGGWGRGLPGGACVEGTVQPVAVFITALRFMLSLLLVNM